MRKKPSEGNNYFCIVPWTHTYLSPQSERRLCCASREEATHAQQYLDRGKSNNESSSYRPISLEEHWNGEHIRNVRLKLLEGLEIPECEVCNHKILNIDIYRNYFNKELFGHKIDEAFESTDDNGFTKMLPISFDYRINNDCNFKCRMCGDQLSSSWEAENRARGLYNNAGENFWANEKYQNQISEFQINVAEKELWEAVKNETVEEIYWVGGEPLIWDFHWEIMQYLVESGHSKKVKVRYNTNLSLINYKNKNLYELLPHFKDVMICASIDGTGSIGEYIRSGLNYEKWLLNFKDGLFLNKLYGERALCLDLTVTSPGLFSIKELMELSLNLDVHTLIKTTYAFDSSIVMSPMMIPRDILEPILDRIIFQARKYSIINKKIENYIHAFVDIKNKKTFEEQFPNFIEGIKVGKQRQLEIDKYRKQEGALEKIFNLDQNLINWWKSI